MDVEELNQQSSPPATTPFLPTHLSDPYLLGMIFESINAARHAVLQYAVSQGFLYKVIKSENGQFIACCCLESCPFWLQITRQKSVIAIRVSIVHNYPLETHYNWQPANSMKYLKPHHQDIYNNDHTIKPQQVQAIKKGQCNNVSYKQAW
jgi:hypothetical protein